jgi:uncharacterized protein YgiM (DUF1202 family)
MCKCKDGYTWGQDQKHCEQIVATTINKQYLLTNSRVNIRDSASVVSNIIGKTSPKTKYEITDLHDIGWVKIKFGSKEGYVSKGLIRVVK